MKALIFENLKELNEYLEHRKAGDLAYIIHNFHVVNQVEDPKTKRIGYVTLDKILIVEK